MKRISIIPVLMFAHTTFAIVIANPPFSDELCNEVQVTIRQNKKDGSNTEQKQPWQQLFSCAMTSPKQGQRLVDNACSQLCQEIQLLPTRDLLTDYKASEKLQLLLAVLSVAYKQELKINESTNQMVHNVINLNTLRSHLSDIQKQLREKRAETKELKNAREALRNLYTEQATALNKFHEKYATINAQENLTSEAKRAAIAKLIDKTQRTENRQQIEKAEKQIQDMVNQVRPKLDSLKEHVRLVDTQITYCSAMIRLLSAKN